jgi:hypothetical protein
VQFLATVSCFLESPTIQLLLIDTNNIWRNMVVGSRQQRLLEDFKKVARDKRYECRGIEALMPCKSCPKSSRNWKME